MSGSRFFFSLLWNGEQDENSKKKELKIDRKEPTLLQALNN